MRRLAKEELRESLEQAFESYRDLLENVTASRYLRRVLPVGDDDWLVVVGNLGNSRNSWGAVIANIEPGMSGFEGVGTFLQSGVAGSVTVWGGDVSDYPSDGAGPG